MEVYNKLVKLNVPTVTCIGKFDGIHKGHRLLINEAKKFAKAYKTDAGCEAPKVLVFTFRVMESDKKKNIYTEEEKLYLLEELGVDIVISLEFNAELKSIKAEDFVEQILINKLNIKGLFVGEDFRFGFNRNGNIELLQFLSEPNDYYFKAIKKLSENGEIISSTRVREALTENALEEGNAMLGDNFFVMGKVVRGKQLGRTIGFPTANIKVAQEKIMPFYGAYLTEVIVKDRKYYGISNYGMRPTVDGDNPNLETFIDNFDENIYGEKIIVKFLKFLRTEKKFGNVDELRAQLEEDKKSIYNMHKKN
ncbi:MAG: bifunctional riboflavin kinase/FAD synthetase [Lachnospiraceae bacterium]|nr:bifunctional riboflavin kinase/FAD synthetase [Lachnospiraceae bacterium]